jgi:hypothetical protein
LSLPLALKCIQFPEEVWMKIRPVDAALAKIRTIEDVRQFRKALAKKQAELLKKKEGSRK